MLAGGKELEEDSDLEIVVGDIKDRSSLRPAVFQVRAGASTTPRSETFFQSEK